MSRINISLVNDCNLQKDVIDTLNHFHFRKIRLTNNTENVVLRATVDELSICIKSNNSNTKRISNNSLLIIQTELDRYKQESKNLLVNRVAPTSNHFVPFIDALADEVEKKILSLLNSKNDIGKGKPFGVVMSHDVDGVGRFYSGSLKSAIVFFGNAIRTWKNPVISLSYLAKSLRFLSGNVDYYGFDLIVKVAKKYNFKPVLFFYVHLDNENNLNLLERLKGVNPNYRLTNIKSVVDKLKVFGAEVGLHGSYKSANNLDLFRQEKNSLEEELNITCKSTRQHYLNSYGGISLGNYCQTGIRYDFTCGTVYEDAFYCGTCRPFYYQPIASSNAVIIIPMVFMDAVSLYFRPANKAEICLEIDRLLAILKQYGGFASFNFHQRMISAIPEFYDIYEYLASKTIEMKGEILKADNLDEIYEMQ